VSAAATCTRTTGSTEKPQPAAPDQIVNKRLLEDSRHVGDSDGVSTVDTNTAESTSTGSPTGATDSGAGSVQRSAVRTNAANAAGSGNFTVAATVATTTTSTAAAAGCGDERETGCASSRTDRTTRLVRATVTACATDQTGVSTTVSMDRSTGLNHQIAEHTDDENTLSKRRECACTGDSEIVVVQFSGVLDDAANRHVTQCARSELDG
jgi:hypothetical protein